MANYRLGLRPEAIQKGEGGRLRKPQGITDVCQWLCSLVAGGCRQQAEPGENVNPARRDPARGT